MEWGLLTDVGWKKCIRLSEDEGGEAGMKYFAKALAATTVANSIISVQTVHTHF